MNVVFLKVAEVELNEAVIFYNIQREGLGYEFSSEVNHTIERIIENPEAWASQRTRFWGVSPYIKMMVKNRRIEQKGMS